ncbi:MAG: L-serine dehydratase, iron-sulfur-dependent subunit beta [Ignavibacteria bacterium GWA2_55_11]|nr:MAG: L-serine dehydratase, iron-sulfur-dependent subunit beta [Ignavibacteria bacterium GWA2_55_11]OGU43603.1 MAG: L-serine dehydratase, iron-sulfur-dependent subunit beta [Ignavibacteria bacterium GWC2_56_12]OGU61941.1 MAG: L-serine dehydratase, iron-sulfur-dependent subunit beta [Ignavibacteria bacterium RIFCSPHIGHO2_02_FULL_56_12]OGU68931.1 MAG: L-serine dehydratase, iron-sulfur-dependent subunit beta [Ignavibacteria bacterium RIFCSPLOWO2_02_FULL_55_14]OGU72740.1 MAG: L-serine dehydratase
MPDYPSLFDILGPIMIGPSSSHTAGASRIGSIARQLLGDTPVRAVITLYNSFAKTHKGHGTDKAIVGGILGFGPDDERIRDAFDHAKRSGLAWDFAFVGDLSRFHSNTARVGLTGKDGGTIEVVGASLGGGRIKIQEIEGFPVDFQAQLHTLVVIAEDIPGSIKQISGVIAEEGVNIASMYVSRTEKKANMVIELDQPITASSMERIRTLTWVQFVRLVNPIVEGTSRYEK